MATIPAGISGQAISTEASGEALGLAEAVGDAVAESEGVADAVGDAVAESEGVADAVGDAVREEVGRAEALGETDGEMLAVGAAGIDAESVGVADSTTGSGVGDALAESVGTMSVGDAETISPERAVSAASNALLAISLGSDDADALGESIDVAEADASTDAEGATVVDVVADGVLTDEWDTLADADADADAEALGDIDSVDDALADGDAVPIGSTMQGS